jgi:hypothetical protein
MYTRNNPFSVQAIYVLCLLGLGLILQGCQVNSGGSKGIDPYSSHPNNETKRPLSEKKEPLGCLLQPNKNVSPKATQHALVVGINNYQYARQIRNSEGGSLKNLKGAVNDAYMIAKALCRTNKVNLPTERILLNNHATLDNFRQAWEDMVKEAQPDDTLIVTFSGHGGQERDKFPFDECEDCRTNNSDCIERDEMLLFSDFGINETSSSFQGRITDDELFDLFKEADAYNIVFVIDACKSGGMAKGGGTGQIRTGGYFELPREKGRDHPVNCPSSVNHESLPKHVTLIMAAQLDDDDVYEASFGNEYHGALSWFFAQALNGKPDSNGNGYLERGELATYLVRNVEKSMREKKRRTQIPSLSPDDKTVAVLKVGGESCAPVQNPKIPDIVIATQPKGIAEGLKLEHVRPVRSDEEPDLHFIVKDHYIGENQPVDVFDELPDSDPPIATLSSNESHLWQRVIDKERLLNVLSTQANLCLKPLLITLREHEKKKGKLPTFKRGEKLHFSVKPSDEQKDLSALILFNLASNGELQFLYPLTRNHEGKEDPWKIDKFPYLPEIEVSSPFGKDNLVAILCKKPAKDLRTLLERSAPNLPKHEEILKHLHNNTCQVEQYPSFSAK